MKGITYRRRRDQAEMIRVDAYWLAVRYADEPVPFWPMDFPVEMEENPAQTVG